MSGRRKGSGAAAAGAPGEDGAETFEQAIARLEELVRDMESGRMGLEESLAAFEEGSRLARLCGLRLQAAEKTVQKLVAEMGGSFRLEPLEEGPDGEGPGTPGTR
jgi:exodeoxyribonuclease VII small subunit